MEDNAHCAHTRMLMQLHITVLHALELNEFNNTMTLDNMTDYFF